jgi:hypothetical protein
VEYEDDEDNDEIYLDEDEDYPFDEDINNEEAFDRINQEAIDELLAEPGDEQDVDPINREEQEVEENDEDIELPLMDDVSDTMDIEMSYTSRGEHVPEAQRNNRTIGERIRTAYHNLPYKTIPKIMLKYLSMVSTHQLNLLPAKGGVCTYLSPQPCYYHWEELGF